MNKLLMLICVMVLAGCSASIGTPPRTTTYTTTAPVVTHTTPVAETTTVTHY